MKVRTTQVWAAMALLATALSGYLIGQHRSTGTDSSDTAAHDSSRHAQAATAAVPAQADTGRMVLYYRNPMGLPDTSPVPKKDPMGMDYLPVYADDNSGSPGTVQVSPERLQLLGVRTAKVERRPLDSALQAVGRVDIDERRVHEVAPRFEGWIERLHVGATGDAVRKGQPLFTVYSPELASTRAELAIAEQLQAASGEADASAQWAAQRLVQAARTRLDNWEALGTPDGSRVVVHSPVDGIVLEKTAVAGMRFTPGMAVYRIANLSTVWVLADIYEQDHTRVSIGQQARIGIDAYPGRHFDARISQVYPVRNAATRTSTVRLELANGQRLLQPGMYAQVEIYTAGDTARLTVPDSAVIDDGQQRIVLVAEGQGRFRPQVVTTGLRGREQVEILSGLTDGQEVVMSAHFLIDAESRLQAALAGFRPSDTTRPPARYSTQGAFDAYFQDSQTVMLSHEAIASLSWPAMTMEFQLASPRLVAGLVPGTPVRFSFEEQGQGRFVVVSIEAMGRSGPAMAPTTNGPQPGGR